MSTTDNKALATSPQTSHATRQDGWTRQRQCAFLRALAASHSVAGAARAAGMSRQSAYALRARLKGEPFDLAWQAALQCRFDALAEAALERALNGVEVPHFYRGELIGTSRRYDERLTVALLAMRAGLAAPRPAPGHRLASHEMGHFGKLVARVERGPETWLEETREVLDRLEEDTPGDWAGEGADENWAGEGAGSPMAGPWGGGEG